MRSLRTWRVWLTGVGVLACLPMTVQAGGARTFEMDNFLAAPDLTLHGTAVTADGGLVPGIHSEARLGPSLPVVWKVRGTADGTVFAAGGDPGALLMLPAVGHGRVLMQVSSAEFTALAVLDDGRLAVAESPGGRIHLLSSDGTPGPILATGARYIWDMLSDGAGGLWIAAGDAGALLHWRADGDSITTVLNLGVEQARCLAPGPQPGSVAVGTSGDGRVHLVQPDGSHRILLDAEEPEIVALTGDGGGGFYLAVAGSNTSEQASATPSGTTAGTSSAVPGAIAHLGPDGVLVELWRSAEEMPLTLLSGPDGLLWAGFSPGGALRSLEDSGRWRLLARLQAESITDLYRMPDDTVAVSTGGQGAIHVFDGAQRSEGRTLSPVHDAGQGTVFGAARFRLRSGSARRASLSFRSGPTAGPDESWTPWSSWTSGGHVAAPVAAPGRYLQWRARLKPARSAEEPVELAHVEVSYLPVNHPPTITKVEVLPSGVAIQLLPAPPGQAGMPAGSAGAGVGGSAPQQSAPTPPVRRFYQPGQRTVRWESHDADGDALTATLQVRADGEQLFAPFASAPEAPFLVFDESRLADGGYVMRVVVTDGADNTPSRSHTVSRDSARFVIDRTPPAVEGLSWRRRGAEWEFRFSVKDEVSGPAGVRLTLDGGASILVLPEDGIEDSPEESYRLTTPAVSGTHVAVVEAGDGAGNRGTARLLFNDQE